jgi:hypothetical protein
VTGFGDGFGAGVGAGVGVGLGEGLILVELKIGSVLLVSA